MLWNVKNALSRDVEREHLNKILADIRSRVDGAYDMLNQVGNASTVDVYGVVGGMVSGNTESGITVTYRPATKKLDFIVKDFKITLTGDVTGEGTVTALGDVIIPVTIPTGDYVEEAPNDGSPYWRQAEQWEMVPEPLWYIDEIEPGGFTVLDQDYNWVTRQIAGTAGRITVTNGDGINDNPAIDLAPLANSNTGSIVGITRDSYGRVSGTRNVTTNDLTEGTLNLYFTDERAQDAVGTILSNTSEIVLTYDDPTPKITAALTQSVRDAIAHGGVPAGGTTGQVLGKTSNTDYAVGWRTIPRYVPAFLRNGTASNIPLNADGTVPAKLRNGTTSNIPTLG